MGLSENDILQVSYRGLSMGQRILMVRTFIFTGAGVALQTVPEALLALANDLAPGGPNDQMVAAYIQCVPTNYRLEKVRVQRIWPVRSVLMEVDIGANGTWPSTASVPNDTGACIVRTALAGRKQRGVIKVGPLPTDAAVSGILTAGYQTALEAFAHTLDDPHDVASIGGTIFPVLFHRADHTNDRILQGLIRTEARVLLPRTVGRGE